MRVKAVPLVLSIAFAGFSVVALGQQAATSNQSNRVLAGEGHADLHQGGVSDAVEVNMSDVPAGTPKTALPPPEPRSGVSREVYNARKEAAAKGLALAASGAKGDAPTNSIGRETPGATPVFIGQAEQGTIAPADMAVAVSPQFVVQLVNESIAVYNKSGVLQSGFPKPLSSFFSSNTGDIGDVRAFYDWNKGRFVVLADDFTAGVIHIAASATSSPLGAWHQYSLAPWGAADCRTSGTACPDFPQLGYDDTTIYVGINFFTASGPVSDWMLLLPKTKIYAGSGFSYNIWTNLSWNGVLVDTVHPSVPAVAFEHPRAGIAVNSFNINFGGGQCSVSACNGLVFWGFSNNLVASGSPGPELSAVGIATANNYSLPASANEPSCVGCIDTGDVRISGTPTLHAGMISASLNTNGSDKHSHALWFQARLFLNDNDARCTGAFLNTCPQVTGAQLLNEDCFFCGGQGAAGSSYYAALAPDAAGDLTMIYNYSDNNANAETAYTARRATQAQNSMHDAGFVMCGGASTAVGRWGDYEANVTDNSAAGQHYTWFSGMNATSGGSWGTCIGRDGFTAINQP